MMLNILSYVSLYRSRESIEILILLGNGGQSVVVPVVTEVVVNLVDQRFRQRLVICEASEESHPVMQLCALVNCTHLFVIV